MAFCSRLLLLLLILHTTSAWAQGRNAEPSGRRLPVGRLAFVQGTVMVGNSMARDGQDLFEGDIVETKQGKCTILLGRESAFHLDVESQMRINRYVLQKGKKDEEAKLRLDFGKTKALIKTKTKLRKDFEVHARNAIMGVRGTSIFIDNPKDQTQPMSFATLSGKAELSLAVRAAGTAARVEKVEIETNELVRTDTASAGGDKPFEVQTVSPEVLHEMADQVSAPPVLPRTLHEVKNFVGSSGGSFVPEVEPKIPVALPGIRKPRDSSGDEPADAPPADFWDGGAGDADGGRDDPATSGGDSIVNNTTLQTRRITVNFYWEPR